MRIFITGGTGFIGRHVVEKLQSEGHDLLILSHRPKIATSLFGTLKKVTLVKGGLSNINNWKNKVKLFKPKAAIHMAWEGIPDYSVERLLKMFILNPVASAWRYSFFSKRKRKDFFPFIFCGYLEGVAMIFGMWSAFFKIVNKKT